MSILKWVFFVNILIILSNVYVQGQLPVQTYKLVTGSSIVQSKNYYLLTLFEKNKEVRIILESDKVLSAITKTKSGNLSQSLKECGNEAGCFADRMKFSETEIREIGNRLAELYSSNKAFAKLVKEDLISSGTYIIYNKLSPQQLLVKAWEQDAKGINFTIGVYLEGKKANYQSIDSTSLHVKGANYSGFLYNTANLLTEEYKNDKLFFTLPLQAALHSLEMNERVNAADYEPMVSTVNKPAYDRVKSIKWNTYKYSVILVPGAGPDDPEEALSAEGMIRCRLAAIEYRKGLSPFILVSGGKVHPYKTKFCEAIEMKKFLMADLKIPENAIIVDPHARHTTTNMRNCSRLIYRYGLPFKMACLAVTTRAQSTMISMTLLARCLTELQEQPYKNGARISETETEFFPLIEALQINPAEPMDP